VTASLSPTAPLTSRLRTPGIVALAAIAVGTALVLRDPHEHGSWGVCPLLVITGLPCPGCGGLRATSDLLHGRLAEAASSNLYAVLTVGIAAIAFASWTAALARGREWAGQRHLPRASIVWFTGLVAFGLLRLVPGMTELRP